MLSFKAALRASRIADIAAHALDALRSLLRGYASLCELLEKGDHLGVTDGHQVGRTDIALLDDVHGNDRASPAWLLFNRLKAFELDVLRWRQQVRSIQSPRPSLASVWATLSSSRTTRCPPGG